VSATCRFRRRAGQINAGWLLFLGSITALAVLAGVLVWLPAQQSTGGSRPLVVYCAAGIKAPVAAVAKQYEKEFGVPVKLQYGGSQTLLANIEVSRQGDLYLPADESYLELARGKKLLAESIPLAQMKPVLAVAKGNPKGIKSLGDLLAESSRLAQANPDAAAVGKLVREALKKSGDWEAIEEHTTVFKPTVNDVAADVQVGTVDAAFIWDALVRQMPDLDAVELPELSEASATIGIGVLSCCEQPTAALRFARYLGASDKGLLEFEKDGYTPVEGDLWAAVPEVRLSSGSMLRPAIEETIIAFEQREGVRVTRKYNGCGILVAEMKAGALPDAYFACDSSFMRQVNDLFLDSSDISKNELVILVQKGNPHGIKSLADLGKPGLKIGIGHEQQCAMGALTQQTLVEGGYRSQVMKNVAVQTPTGDMLVNQLRAGSLDAAIAYLSNAAAAGDDLSAIRIVGIPCAIAIQPVAISKDCRQKQLTSRLLSAIRSAESRERFESYGFEWRAEP
jgi:molybdenum ABC transporter molybdate-binding protein